MESELATRKRNRLKNHDYSLPRAYFVKICTRDRKNIFWSKDQPNFVGATIGHPQNVELSSYGKIVNDSINYIHTVYPIVSVEQYVIMPNHLHLILLIHADECGRPLVAPTISRVIQQIKGYITKQIEFPIWQRSFHDHVIRDKSDYEKIAKYIQENPFKWQYDCFYTEE